MTRRQIVGVRKVGSQVPFELLQLLSQARLAIAGVPQIGDGSEHFQG